MIQHGVPFSVFGFACSCGCISPHHLLTCPSTRLRKGDVPDQDSIRFAPPLVQRCTTVTSIERCPVHARLTGKISSRPISCANRAFAQVWLDDGTLACWGLSAVLLDPAEPASLHGLQCNPKFCIQIDVAFALLAAFWLLSGRSCGCLMVTLPSQQQPVKASSSPPSRPNDQKRQHSQLYEHDSAASTDSNISLPQH